MNENKNEFRDRGLPQNLQFRRLFGIMARFMDEKRAMDFHFAVANTDIVIPPTAQLDTFGNTIIRYFLACESMDRVGVCVLRHGSMSMMKPQIIAPSSYSRMLLDGFGSEAQRYADWLQEHSADLHILRYGYSLKNESFSEEQIHTTLEDLLDRIVKESEEKKDPFRAVVKGVDSPWDVCLIRLFWDVVHRSARKNIMDMAKHRMFERREGLPFKLHNEIEEAFTAAEKDRTLVKSLGALLQRHNVFAAYEDRFFKLMK